MDIGRLGIWLWGGSLGRDVAREAERLGYGAIWLGGSPPGDLAQVDDLLSATSHIKVATGIVNMWKDDAATVAASFHRIEGRHPGRFLLGVGIGHPEGNPEYHKPYEKIVDYLDRLDGAGVPVERRVLAALGPKVLRLARQRAGGAHPYLTTPEHTKAARETLGAGKLLAPEQKVVLSADTGSARATGRAAVERYLGLTNYRRNLLRMGWAEADFDQGGSDRLIDALVLHGSAGEIAEGITAHLDAGADHVCVQPLGPDPLPALRALSEALLR